MNGVLRSVENVDVMDEGYCDEFLDSTTVNKSGKFQYRPQVMYGRLTTDRLARSRVILVRRGKDHSRDID